MKPFLYATAFAPSQNSDPWTLASVVHDIRTVFITAEGETYVPANYDNVYHGPVTLREALANSHNLPAVILQDRVGTDTLLDTAHLFGLTSLRAARRYGLAAGHSWGSRFPPVGSVTCPTMTASRISHSIVPATLQRLCGPDSVRIPASTS